MFNPMTQVILEDGRVIGIGSIENAQLPSCWSASGYSHGPHSSGSGSFEGGNRVSLSIRVHSGQELNAVKDARL